MNAKGEMPQRIGAFFDLDGTLLPGPSLELRFVRYLRVAGEIGLSTGVRWLGRFLRRLLAWKRAGMMERWIAATDGNKAHLVGLENANAESFLGTVSLEPLRFFREGLQRVAWHVAQDHVVCLVTGSLAPLALCAAWRLATKVAASVGRSRPQIHVRATQLEQSGGRWTGELSGEAVVGAAKARAVKALAREYDIDLRQSYAYGDRWTDRALLASVGHAVAVNPSAALEGIALLRGWRAVGWADLEPVVYAPSKKRRAQAGAATQDAVADHREACTAGSGEHHA